MSRVATPSNVNIKNPLALEKVAAGVESGIGRNYSEAAENLILRGAESIRASDAHPDPAVTGDTRAGASSKSATNAA